MKSLFFKKVIWAFDALEEPEHHNNVLFLLGAIARSTSAQIAPVFILTPPYVDNAKTAPTDLQQAYVALGEKRMAEIITKSDLPTMTTGKVLINHDKSIRRHAKHLIDYAKDQNADAIVVATHGRKGAARIFLGSFAESLALYSDIPVFTVNPQTKVRKTISNILFPTTFLPIWRPAFERAVELAKTMDAKMTLYYREPFIPMNAVTGQLTRYIQKEKDERKAAAKEWQSWATHYGVQTELIIEEQPGYLAQGIEESATSGNFDLIAMGTQSDATSAILMGSATRQMIRQAPCPVWIMRID